MKEDLISFKTAKLAKEKGFTTNTNDWTYKRNGVTFYTNAKGGVSGKEDTVKIVTQALLQKWLRDKHSINIQIIWVDTLSDIYVYHISTTNNATRPNSKFYHSYEKALEKALEEGLKKLV